MKKDQRLFRKEVHSREWKRIPSKKDDYIVQTLLKNKDDLCKFFCNFVINCKLQNMKNRENFYVNKLTGERECTNCGIIFKITSKTVTLCNKCNSDRVKSADPVYKMHNRAQTRAKLSGALFDLKKEDITIPETCPVFGYILECSKGRSGGRKNSPSLDRIDPTKGYTKDNIMVMSHLANQMKSHATTEELVMFADWIYKVYKQSEKE
jgi:hypothetical protein